MFFRIFADAKNNNPHVVQIIKPGISLIFTINIVTNNKNANIGINIINFLHVCKHIKLNNALTKNNIGKNHNAELSGILQCNNSERNGTYKTVRTVQLLYITPFLKR